MKHPLLEVLGKINVEMFLKLRVWDEGMFISKAGIWIFFFRKYRIFGILYPRIVETTSLKQL